MSGRVIVVGSVNVDLVARVGQLPRPGETVTGDVFERHQGGKGGNQAVAAARLGRPTLFIGAVGDDAFAAEARRALAAERVDVSMLASLPGEATGVALILVDGAGENEIAVIPGANWAIEPGIVRDSLARLGRLTGDVVLLCNEIPVPVIREALLAARAAGARTIFNPAPASGVDRATWGLADIVTPNRGELATILAAETHRPRRRDPAMEELESRARVLIEPHGSLPGVREAVIITLGSEGVFVLERVPPEPARPLPWVLPGPEAVGAPDGKAAGVEVPAPPAGPESRPVPAIALQAAPVVPASPAPLRAWQVPADRVGTVDSTGAGDAFNGALATALAEGRPLREAVRRAVAAGALATTRVGAREGMPGRADLEAFLAH